MSKRKVQPSAKEGTVSRKKVREAVKKVKKAGRKTKATAAAKARKEASIFDEEEPGFSIWVNWEYTFCHGGGICEGQEDHEYPNHETEYKDHEVRGVYSEDAKDGRGWSRYNESCAVDFQPVSGAEVFLVVVTYSNGSTFGSSSGNVCIVGCYKEESVADLIVKDIETDVNNSNHYGEMKKGKKARFSGYKAWSGYFERLEGVEVHPLRLDA